MPYLFVALWHTENYEKHRRTFRNTDYVFGTRIMFLNTNNANNTNFFDWKYCEALKIRYSCSKKIISFVFYIFFEFKKIVSFRVLMTWLWCLSYRKARNVQKRISGKSGCCIFVASIRDKVVFDNKNLIICGLRVSTSEILVSLTNVINNKKS